LTSCKQCLHFGVCAVRVQLEKQTMMKFPDEKVALVEAQVVSCDHYTLNPGSTRTFEDEQFDDDPEMPARRQPSMPRFDDPGPPAPGMGMVPQSDRASEVIEFEGPGRPPVRREVSYESLEDNPTMQGQAPVRTGGPIRLKLTGLTPPVRR
jgi:hypothetical protein